MTLRLALSLVIPCSSWFISSPRCGPSPILPEDFVLIRIQPSLWSLETNFIAEKNVPSVETGDPERDFCAQNLQRELYMYSPKHTPPLWAQLFPPGNQGQRYC